MATTMLQWEAASALYPAAGAAQAGYTSGTNFPWFSLNFDQTSIEKVYFFGVMPQAYNAGNITVKLIWTAGATGNVVWSAGFLGRVNDEVLDVALSTPIEVTDAVTASADLMVASITWSSPALVAGDWVIVQIRREADDGADTLAADAKLLGVEIQE